MKLLAVVVIGLAVFAIQPATAAASCAEVTCQAIGCPAPCPVVTTTPPPTTTTQPPSRAPEPPVAAPAMPIPAGPKFTG